MAKLSDIPTDVWGEILTYCKNEKKDICESIDEVDVTKLTHNDIDKIKQKTCKLVNKFYENTREDKKKYLKVGDKIYFNNHNGERITGEIHKIMRKNLLMYSDGRGENWRVSISGVTKIET